MADGIARLGFDKDLRDGRAAEDAFVHLYLQARVEVKADEVACRTRRLFVEYRQQSRLTDEWVPSGIAITEAHSWAFLLVGPGIWIHVPVDRLRAVFMKTWRERPDLRKLGGDYDRFKGVAVPVEDLLWAELSEDELRAAARGGRWFGDVF
jgi:hypothetical protein